MGWGGERVEKKEKKSVGHDVKGKEAKYFDSGGYENEEKMQLILTLRAPRVAFHLLDFLLVFFGFISMPNLAFTVEGINQRKFHAASAPVSLLT